MDAEAPSVPSASSTRGLPAVALAALTWGTIGVAVEALYRVSASDPITVGFYRLALSAPVLLFFSRRYAGAKFLRTRPRDRWLLALMAVAFAGYQLCYFAAIPFIGVAAAVLINICSAPVIVALLSGVFLRERLTSVVGLTLAGAVTGAVLLVGGSPEAASWRDLALGAALALGAGLSYSVVALTARAVAGHYHPVQPVALAFTLSALLLLPVVLVRGLPWHYTPAGWALLLYLGLVPTALGYGLYLRGLQTTTATVAAIVALLEPMVSTILAVTLLGEHLSPSGLVGGGLLLASVAFLYLRQK
jgi:DME family drug/metabolite transporter